MLLVAVMMFGQVTAYADDFPPPLPEIIESEDGSRVFVFNPLEDRNYPDMGVYYNAEPLELIYLINLDFATSDNCFRFSSDMQYFAFIPEVSQHTALKFYANGDLVKQYGISQLVEDMSAVGFSVSMAFWENRRERIFDSIDNTLTITTVDGLRYVFDITTGELLEGEVVVHPYGFVNGQRMILDPEPYPPLGVYPTIVTETPTLGNELEESNNNLRIIIGVILGVCGAGVILGFMFRRYKSTQKE